MGVRRRGANYSIAHLILLTRRCVSHVARDAHAHDALASMNTEALKVPALSMYKLVCKVVNVH